MPKIVDATWVKKRLDEGSMPVVNVLGADAYASAHIPDTANVPVDAPDFERRFREVAPDQAAPVVVYCASTDCQASPTAARKLEEIGYRDVYDFEAGMAGWRQAGFDLVRSHQAPAGEQGATGEEAT